MTARRLRVVFFDVGGTLLSARPSVGAAYAQVLAGFGRRLDPALLERRFAACWAETSAHEPPGSDRFSRSPGGERGFWRRLLDQVLGAGEAPLTDAEFDAVHAAFESPARYQVYEDVRPTLEGLGRAGLRMGVISNWDERLPPLLADLDLGRFFEVVVTSGIERCEKPARRMFEAACARAGVLPAEAVHVGDSLRDDVEGARAAGLMGVHLDRSRTFAGDGVVHGLDGLLERVAGATVGRTG